MDKVQEVQDKIMVSNNNKVLEEWDLGVVILIKILGMEKEVQVQGHLVDPVQRELYEPLRAIYSLIHGPRGVALKPKIRRGWKRYRRSDPNARPPAWH